jgi:hypothetical protein
MVSKSNNSMKVAAGWLLIALSVFLIIYGFLSSLLCDRLLIGVGVFGLLWIFFGSPVITKVEHSKTGFVFFLPISVVLVIIWIILRASEVCSA